MTMLKSMGNMLNKKHGDKTKWKCGTLPLNMYNIPDQQVQKLIDSFLTLAVGESFTDVGEDEGEEDLDGNDDDYS